MSKLKETTAWREALIALADQVEDWVKRAGTQSNISIAQGAIHDPTAEVPLLELNVAHGDIVRLEPTAYDVDRVPTRVYLYAYPTLRSAVLYGPRDGIWEVQTDQGVPMNYPWTSEGFFQLVQALSDSRAH